MPDVINAQAGTENRTNIRDLAVKKNGLPKGVKVVTEKDNGLDRNSFLKLLVKELSNQDPLQPVNDKEFISQMAQFSSLEQMHNVAKSVEGLKSMQANNLLGKYVTGKDFVNQRPVNGVVTGVIHDASGNAFLRVSGKQIKISDVSRVTMSTPDAPRAMPP